MKKIGMLSLFASMLIAGSELSAQLATEDIGSEKIEIQEDKEGYPFKVTIEGDWVHKTKIKRDHHSYDVTFAAASADASMVYYYDSCNKEAATAAVSFKKTYLNWKHNPYFTQTNFDTISLILGGYSERLCSWIWRGQVSLNFDNIEYWNFEDYMNYDITLWGRYDLCKNIGFHIGFFAQTGMRIDRVYPIIGIDWKYNDYFTLNLIYPMNISAVYQYNSQWSIALAGRFFDERHRVKKDAHLSEGLWVYRVTGAEGALNYHPVDWISANIHLGYTFGGILKVANRNYHHRRNYDVNGSVYAGGELNVSF